MYEADQYLLLCRRYYFGPFRYMTITYYLDEVKACFFFNFGRHTNELTFTRQHHLVVAGQNWRVTLV